jgi:hypothetical protein
VEEKTPEFTNQNKDNIEPYSQLLMERLQLESRIDDAPELKEGTFT